MLPGDGHNPGREAPALGAASGGKVTVTPCHSLTGETPTALNGVPPMVDTVAVCLPVGPEMAALLASKTGRLLRVGADGDVEWDQPRIGSLPGTYDPNLWVQFSERGDRVLRIEGSVHRHILGHNVHGGPREVVPCARYMIDVCRRWLGVDLPSWEQWRLQRLDLAWVFDAGTEDAAYDFLREMATAWQTTTAARSAPRSFGSTVYVGSVKIYMKGPELAKHPPKWASKADHRRLMSEAVSKVRFEVTYKRRDIERLTYSRLSALDQRPIIESAVAKMLRFGRTTEESVHTVRTIDAVQARLSERYSSARAAALMGTWFKLTTIGEQSTRDSMSRPTYFRHVKELKAAGVAWTGTDVIRLKVRGLPDDFALSPFSPYCVGGVDPHVSRVLAAFAS